MSIKKYETLLKTVDLGSLTRASEVLGYTQSAISHMISGLEDEFGFKLLIRDRSGVRLTEEGKMVIPSIRAVCKANKEVFRQVGTIHGLDIGIIRIGTVLSVSLHVLPDILAEFSEQHPEIEFELLQGSFVDVERWLCEGKIDCGFLPYLERESFEMIPVRTERFLAVFPQTRTMQSERISIDDIQAESLILRTDSLEEDLRQFLNKGRSKSKITYSAKDEYAVLAMVERGLGMSILPELLLDRTQYRIKTQALDPEIQRTICFAYKEGQMISPVVQQIILFIRKSFEKGKTEEETDIISIT